MIFTEPVAAAGSTCTNFPSCHWNTNAIALTFSPSELNFTGPCTLASDDPAVQIRDDLRTGGAAGRLHRFRGHLTHRVRLRDVGVDIRRGPAVLGHVLLDHGLARRVRVAGVPGVGDHHAVGVADPDRAGERAALVRPGGGDEDLRVVVLLLERLHERRHRGHVGGAEHHHLRAGRGDQVGVGCIVGDLLGEDLGVLGLDPEWLQLALRQLHLRGGERVVGHGVGGGGRPLAGRHRLDPVDQRVELVRDRQAHVEDVRQLLAEDQRRAAGALDERVAVPVRHLGGGRGEQRGERAEGQVHVMHGDQVRVVGVDLRRAAVVVEYHQLHLAAEQAAAGVDVVGPEIVAALVGLAIGGEVAGQRQRRADEDGRLGAGAGAAAA